MRLIWIRCIEWVYTMSSLKTSLMIRINLSAVMISIGAIIALSGCSSPEKKLYGFWKTTSLKLDNQSELTITETDSNSYCGNIKGTTIVKVTDSYLTFHKNKFYQLSIGFEVETELKSDSCEGRTEAFKDYYSEYGSWTMLEKDVIFFQPNMGNPYQCTITDVKKKSLSLDCTFRMWFSKPLSYEDYYTQSMQLEAERISK